MKRLLFAIIIFILIGFPINAQINFHLIVKKPVPVKFSKWQQDPNIIQLALSNLTLNSYQNFSISFNIKDEKGRIKTYSRDGDPKVKRFNLSAGQTLVIPGTEAVNFKAVTYNKSIEDIILSTNSLPEGNYLLCVRIIDTLGNDIGNGGEKCELISIYLPEPPNLISPANASNLMSNLPQFIWTPVIGQDPTVQVQYRIKIAKILQGQTPKTAIETNIPILDKFVNTTSYQYLPSDYNLNNYNDDLGFAW